VCVDIFFGILVLLLNLSLGTNNTPDDMPPCIMTETWWEAKVSFVTLNLTEDRDVLGRGSIVVCQMLHPRTIE
jgi:hypothetical protein